MYHHTDSCNNLFSSETVNQLNLIVGDKSNRLKTVGICFSAFDVLHAGHLLMLKDAKSVCDILIVGLHTDPTLNRSDSKNKPIQSVEERYIQLEACKYVDHIIKYATEDDLMNVLRTLYTARKNGGPNIIRILGSDWHGKQYTGWKLPIPVHWHNRDHDWSTTYLRDRIYTAEKTKRGEEKMSNKVIFIQQDTLTHYTIREI